MHHLPLPERPGGGHWLEDVILAAVWGGDGGGRDDQVGDGRGVGRHIDWKGGLAWRDGLHCRAVAGENILEK